MYNYTKLLLVAFICSFISASVVGQTWERMGPVAFTGIQKLSARKIIACNDAGSIYLSTDNGITWAQQLINSNRKFLCLRFVDETNGIVGSNQGFFQKTTDGGKTWTEYYTGYPLDIIAISCPSKDTTYIALTDGNCLRTTNGGLSWAELTVKAFGYQCIVNKLVFPSSTYGVVAGGPNATLFITTDAGNTWSDQSGVTLQEITSLDATKDGKIAYGTRDAYFSTSLDGFHWTLINLQKGDTLKYPIEAIKIHNDTVFAFQEKAKYRITSTFKNSWWATKLLPPEENQNPTISLNQQVNFNDMYFDDENGTGIAVGSWGTMYKLADFGRTGELIHHCNIGNDATTAWVYLEGLESNSNIIHGIANGGETFAHSSDGGATFLTRVEKNYGFGSYMGLHFKDDSSGIIFTGSRKSLNSPGFLNTTDNGATWSYDAKPPRDNMYSVTKSSTGKLYITADSTIYRSIDEGFNWDTLWNFSNSYFDTSLHHVRFMLRSASFLDNDSDIFLETWAMDSILTNPVNGGRITHSLVLASTDGGATWEKRYSFPEIHTLKGMRFITPHLGYALTYFTAVKDSNQSTCWRTADGGYTWNLVLELSRSWTPLTFSKNGKYGILSSTISGAMYVTTDSGYSWKLDSVTYSEGADNVRFVLSHFIDDSTAMLTSNVGFWKKSLGAIKSSVEWKKATSNPYLFIYTRPSPATGHTVRCRVDGLFSIGDTRSIVLKMYDLLGREIKDLTQLVQENNDGARSEFEFSCEGLSTGVYTMVLTTSSGGTTKSMILVK